MSNIIGEMESYSQSPERVGSVMTLSKCLRYLAFGLAVTKSVLHFKLVILRM